MIRGNNENNLLAFSGRDVPGARTNDPSLALTAEQLGPAGLERIAAWPEDLGLTFPDAPPIRVVHGKPGNPNVSIHRAQPDDATLSGWLAGVAEPVVIAGHTHLTLDRCVGRWRVFNPGAVGMPFDRDQRASYLILEADGGAWRPTFRRVAYNVGRVLAEIVRLDYEGRFGVVGRWIAEEVRRAMPVAGPYMNWLAERHPGAPLEIASFEAFLAQPDWQRYLWEAYRIEADGAEESME